MSALSAYERSVADMFFFSFVRGCLSILRDSFRVGPHICIVFDLLGKSLATFLKENHFRPFPPHQLQHISRQLFSGVACKHLTMASFVYF